MDPYNVGIDQNLQLAYLEFTRAPGLQHANDQHPPLNHSQGPVLDPLNHGNGPLNGGLKSWENHLTKWEMIHCRVRLPDGINKYK
jgi:hypothetical protein